MKPHVLIAAFALAACGPLANRLVEPRLNTIAPGAAQQLAAVPAAHRPLHDGLFIADLHADTLLWERDLLVRSDRGHLDLPRLAEGGVDLQVFTIVTATHGETPTATGHCVRANALNSTGLLTVVQGRPPNTWFNLEARALHQAARLRDAEARSRDPKLVLIRTAEDLDRLVRAPPTERRIGALLGVEGANWIGEDDAGEATVRAQIRTLFDAGVRVLALTHRHDNALAGASEGCAAYGLTRQGRWALAEAQSLGMVIDLAHISPIALREAMPLLRGPPIVSHTGVQAGCAPPCYAPRNLADEEIRLIAARGGIIGIGYWPEAVGANGVADILRAIRRVVTALSEPAFARAHPALDPYDHVALGGDYDGAVEVPFDTTGLPILTYALLQSVTLDQLRRITGRNACRVLAARLPGGDAVGCSVTDRAE